jgi:hypothetical protein
LISPSATPDEELLHHALLQLAELVAVVIHGLDFGVQNQAKTKVQVLQYNILNLFQSGLFTNNIRIKYYDFGHLKY